MNLLKNIFNCWIRAATQGWYFTRYECVGELNTYLSIPQTTSFYLLNTPCVIHKPRIFCKALFDFFLWMNACPCSPKQNSKPNYHSAGSNFLMGIYICTTHCTLHHASSRPRGSERPWLVLKNGGARWSQIFQKVSISTREDFMVKESYKVRKTGKRLRPMCNKPWQ